MHDSQSISEQPPVGEDPLGPVATMPAVTFGARQAALAGVGRGMAGNYHDYLPAAMFTWHITCTSMTFAGGSPHGGVQTFS